MENLCGNKKSWRHIYIFVGLRTYMGTREVRGRFVVCRCGIFNYASPYKSIKSVKKCHRIMSSEHISLKDIWSEREYYMSNITLSLKSLRCRSVKNKFHLSETITKCLDWKRVVCPIPPPPIAHSTLPSCWLSLNPPLQSCSCWKA